MERVAFLVEKTSERIDCLLNPETLEITRRSGVRERRLNGHLVHGRGANETPLLYAGGGVTEFTLCLLFDVALRSPLAAHTIVQPQVSLPTGETHPASINPGDVPQNRPEIIDVRTLTERVWRLAEHTTDDQGNGEPPLVRMIWGKAWNILGLVTDAAERFEGFTGAGVPQRSWMRLRFRRVPDEVLPTESEMPALQPLTPVATPWEDLPAPTEIPLPLPESEEDAGLSEPLYNIAQQHGLPPSCWREIAQLSRIANPFRVPADAAITLPGANSSPGVS